MAVAVIIVLALAVIGVVEARIAAAVEEEKVVDVTLATSTEILPLIAIIGIVVVERARVEVVVAGVDIVVEEKYLAGIGGAASTGAVVAGAVVIGIVVGIAAAVVAEHMICG